MTPAIVVITGAGIVTPLAQSPADLHDVLCAPGGGAAAGVVVGADAGRGAASDRGSDHATDAGPHAGSDASADAGLAPRVSTFSTADLPCDRGATIAPEALERALGPRALATIDKPGRLALLAAQRALASACLIPDAQHEVGLVLGTMFAGARTIATFDRRALTIGPEYASPLDFANTVLNAPAGQVAIRLALRGINATVAGGHASGLQAVAYAADLVSARRADALIAGGVEELFAEAFTGFCRTGALCGTNGRPGHVPIPFDARSTGLALGEGAGMVVVEAASSAASRGAAVLGRIAGAAAETDPDAIARGFCGREAIAATIRAALASAGVTADGIDAVSASANGSIAADAEEAAALADVFAGRPTPLAITAIKAVTGEMLGASGPIQIISLLEAMRQRTLPGIRGLADARACDVRDGLSGVPRSLAIETGLVLAVSPEGGCCAMVIRAPAEAAS